MVVTANKHTKHIATIFLPLPGKMAATLVLGFENIFGAEMIITTGDEGELEVWAPVTAGLTVLDHDTDINEVDDDEYESQT